MKLRNYLLLLVMIPFCAVAQDLDTSFSQVRAKAEAKDYNGAIKILQQLEKKYPENEDVKVYEGRVYSWKRDFNKSKKILRPIVDREKPNVEALEALINAYYWSFDFDACISYCDKYLETQPESADILLIKATSLEKTGRDAEALAILDKLPDTHNSGEKAEGLKTIISRKTKNAIAASYLNISTFDPGDPPTHFGYVEYLRKFTKSTVIGRVNISNRSDKTEVLGEVDYYHTFKRSYIYTNAAVSNGEFIFPQLRLGAEYYFAPQGHFDFSLGGRYMHFKDNDVTLVTGQAAYRFQKYTLAYRPYYDLDSGLMSHVVSIQRYNEDTENLVRLELQYGNVPYLYIYSNTTEPLRAYRAGIQYQHKIGDSFFIKPIFLYEYEEYFPSSYRHKFNCQVIFTKRF
ncbi:YaiO family outer membrane beta-barrel protein [Flavobacterium sp. DG1-102-2]|uniref:YaiO family outer membrane beta-barrel protein n=1 Tax=Flavobacterium sp. DG1-102-2 TaxID=3081663 RepID=UPI00294A017F|nr:YaiO family outer membrane beta-barrel protein [Flavobacterium sp. DG1-102-2]MDV6168474.1 YaiO family outer membrane beta-barrel protein [Flavobacterium sp. DG1-102-2]